MERGWVLAKLGRHEEALSDLEQVIEAADASEDVRERSRRHKGWVLDELGRVEEALHAYELSDRSEFEPFHQAIGTLSHATFLAEKQSMRDKALQAYDEVIDTPGIDQHLLIEAILRKSFSLEEINEGMDRIRPLENLHGYERAKAIHRTIQCLRSLDRHSEVPALCHELLNIPEASEDFHPFARKVLRLGKNQ